MNKITEKAQLFTERLRAVVLREAKETKVAAEILINLINYHLKINKVKPNEKQIEFLKLHSIDLVKILPMIIMFPTPIPYIEIALIFKAMGFDFLLPKKEDLEIPKSSQDLN